MKLRTFSGRPASQDAQELREFIELLKDARSYLEIGARHGDTFHAVMSSLSPGACGLAIDLPGGAWGTAASESSLRTACADLRDRGYAVDYLIADSHNRATETLARDYFSDRGFARIDAVLIDGDHRYEGVKRDFDLYSPPARCVAFHDIAGEGQTTKTPERLPVEVPRFWREIREGFRHREIISPRSRMGIGVLWTD